MASESTPGTDVSNFTLVPYGDRIGLPAQGAARAPGWTYDDPIVLKSSGAGVVAYRARHPVSLRTAATARDTAASARGVP